MSWPTVASSEHHITVLILTIKKELLIQRSNPTEQHTEVSHDGQIRTENDILAPAGV